MLIKPSNQIFTQLIYPDIPYEEAYIPHYGGIAIVLSPNLLFDYSFYITRIGGFLNKFNNAFKQSKKKYNNQLSFSKNNIIRHHTTNNATDLQKKIKIAKKLINKQCQIMGKSLIGFMYSHELLFNKKIKLEKYCLMIIIYKNVCKNIDIIIKLCKKNNIKVIMYDNYLGINNFIKVIDDNIN